MIQTEYIKIRIYDTEIYSLAEKMKEYKHPWINIIIKDNYPDTIEFDDD
jgi:hypothetical protein